MKSQSTKRRYAGDHNDYDDSMECKSTRSSTKVKVKGSSHVIVMSFMPA